MVLDAFIIEELKKHERDRKDDRPQLEIAIPLPEPKPEPKEETPKRGVIHIQIV